MARVTLKSYEFRRERETTWHELEALVEKAEKGNLDALTTDELLRLPSLYRATLSSLSVARSISLDRAVLDYLESLAARAYFVVYGARGDLRSAITDFVLRGFPAAVRAARWPLVLSAAFFLLGSAVAYLLVAADPEWFYSFVPPGMAQGRDPTATAEALRAALYDDGGALADRLYAFASFLFSHNGGLALLCFALGFALGVPVILLQFYNGLGLGAFLALYQSKGLSLDLLAWLSVHGTTEILAFWLAGAAGLAIGSAVAFPGEYSRLEMLARRGREAAKIAIGVVAMLFVAALLEGFARQLVTDIDARFSIGLGMALFWTVYFTRAGRERPGVGGDGDGESG